MIRRFYVNHFRCLENFELPIAGQSSVLLIGKNGSGKTAVGMALEVLQKIGRGTSRVGDLIKAKDFAWGRTDVPVRFEIEIESGDLTYGYTIAFELPAGFKEARVLKETLTVGGTPIYDRELAQVHQARSGRENEASFRIDWHLVALPIVSDESSKDLYIVKRWLARMLILRPIPALISGDSSEETLAPTLHATDFGAWWAGLVAEGLSASTRINEYLNQVMPDLKDIKNPVLIGKDTRSLVVQFSNNSGTITVPFQDLSDGEKCFMICALVLATNAAHGPLLCYWDEPDNYLAPSEVQHFVLALRREFLTRGQFIATSHNPEAIRSFADENTLVLGRRHHLEPTMVRPLSELQVSGDLVGALIRGDVEP